MDFAQIIITVLQKIGLAGLGVLGIGFLIGFHELGHFLFCKLFGVRVPSFSIGLGPRLFKKKIGETEFALSAFPIGGGVEVAGQDDDGTYKKSSKKDLFTDKPYYQKMIILAGGILFNFIFAYTVIVFLFSTGMPKNMLLYPSNASTVVNKVSPGSPAANIGIKPGDAIVSINGKSCENQGKNFLETAIPLAGKDATITVKQNGINKNFKITLGDVKSGSVFGAYFEIEDLQKLGFSESIKQSFKFAMATLSRISMALKSIVYKGNVKAVGGPISILAEATKCAEQGYKMLLLLLAILSLNFVFFNILPLPIFDGGQALIYTVEAIIRRPLPMKIREAIAIGCWILMIGLYLALAAKDIWHYTNDWFK